MTTRRLARRAFRLSVACVAVALSAAGASAQDVGASATSIQLLHGSGFALGADARDILTFEHASGWSLGSNFFFFDVSEPFADGTEVYGEWYGRLSWSRLGLTRGGSGALADVSFAGSLNAGQGFRAALAGVTLHLKVPRFAYLDVDVMAYDDRSDDAMSWIVTPAWELPFALGKARLRFRGFADLIGAEGSRARQLLAQPQLLLDVGALLGRADRLFAGIEVQYWHNKFGVVGASESLPQMMLLWQL